MNKEEAMKLLIKIRDQENPGNLKVSEIINHVLGKIDMEDEFDQKYGHYQEEDFRDFISRKLQTREDEFTPIKDELFTYGIEDKSVGIHLPPLPENLRGMFKSGKPLQVSHAMAKLSISFFNSLDKIEQKREQGDEAFKGTDKIYMISPIFGSPTFKKFRILRVLRLLGFDTKYYSQKQLSDENFVANNPEAKLGVDKFGKEKNLGSVAISFEKMRSPRWRRNIGRIKNILERVNSKMDNHEMAQER